ncbi:hypothetical protein DL96DRAFT_1565104 [Flagelloscypha sp. PMI_526]|nr:hypothetical protein DL96DRAFT_1565104 [Flagelloscypha sp. PMI_526]
MLNRQLRARKSNTSLGVRWCENAVQLDASRQETKQMATKKNPCNDPLFLCSTAPIVFTALHLNGLEYTCRTDPCAVMPQRYVSGNWLGGGGERVDSVEAPKFELYGEAKHAGLVQAGKNKRWQTYIFKPNYVVARAAGVTEADISQKVPKTDFGSQLRKTNTNAANIYTLEYSITKDGNDELGYGFGLTPPFLIH